MSGRSTYEEFSALSVLADPLSRAVIVAMRQTRIPRTSDGLTDMLGGRYVLRTVQRRLAELEGLRLVRRVGDDEPVDGDGSVRAVGASPAAASGVDPKPCPIRRRMPAPKVARPVPGPKRIPWVLTEAGSDLYRIGVLMTQIAAAPFPRLAREANAHQRTQILESVLASLSEPVTRETLRLLAVGPRLAEVLEQECHGRLDISRRSVYRRLALLTHHGAIVREETHEVPRRVRYRLNQRWRPVVAILLLAAWWEWQYEGDLVTDRPISSDLPALVGAVAPLVEMPPGFDGACQRWCVDDPAYGSEMTLVVEGQKLRVVEETQPILGSVDATVHGSPRTWCTTLVGQRRNPLTMDGDKDLVAPTIAAVHRMLLYPVTLTALRSVIPE